MAAGDEDEEGDQGRLRASAADIYERVKREAAEELERPVPALAFSGAFAGATVGFGVIASAAASAALVGHQDARLIGTLFFPIGFIVVIVGRAQLFTENTLYPVTVLLDERGHVLSTLRLWAIVLSANLGGALLFALLVTKTAALSPEIVATVAEEGHHVTTGTSATFFWSAVLGGWVIALVAWLIQAGRGVLGQIALIWTLAFVVGLAGLDHCVSTTVEVLCAVLRSEVALGHALAWFAIVLVGNILGGVLIVAVLNYGQVRAGEK
ncbi:MAG TPA: formate/nitrite transporter family protein [Solirubrobacteraceae bacterium]|jgi:formate/nitrite transporter FocA (FNT family)|nr:formate/nitrite transporter family protein [Solirubrobacteraceae bacterium]